MVRWAKLPTPTWATDLNAQVCRDAGKDPAPLRWWRRVGEQRTYGETRGADGRIDVGLGTDGFERGVLLHEIAHYLCGHGEGHGERFWRKAFDLYEAHGGDNIFDFVVDEFSYRKGAYYEAARRPRWRSATVAYDASRQTQVAARTHYSAARFNAGDAVVLGGNLPWEYKGKRATIVDVRRTRALVQMIDGAGRFGPGAQCLVNMNALTLASEVKAPSMTASKARAEIAAAAVAAELGGAWPIEAKTLRAWHEALMAEAGS